MGLVSIFNKLYYNKRFNAHIIYFNPFQGKEKKYYQNLNQ